MVRLAGHVGLGQFRPEPGRFDQFDRRHVVGMGVDPVGRKQPLGPHQANDTGQLGPGFERRLQAAIGQAQVAAPIEPQNLGGGGGFGGPNLAGAERRRLAVGQVEDADAKARRP